MKRLDLKTYDDVADRSPKYFVGGAVLLGAMAWREFSQTGEMGLRFWLMLLTVVAFVVGAMVLKGRHRITIEVLEDSEGKGDLKILHRTGLEQVLSQSQLAYVKLDKVQLMIHFHEGEELRRTSIPIKGASKRKVGDLMEILEKWQA